MLSEETQQLLRSAGWFPSRQIDTTHYIDILSQEGYVVFPTVVRFLAQFGGLKITWLDKEHSIEHTTHFDAASAAQDVYNEGYVSNYAQRLGRSVCVIGEAANGNTTLMMDDSGSMYGGSDSKLVLFGTSYIDALEYLVCNNGKITIIP